MKWSESYNRYSLIQLDSELRQEPINHIGYEEKKIKTKKYNVELERNAGWVEIKVTKTQVVLRKYDKEPTLYEKRLWQLFYKMGFIYLNKIDKSKFCYGKNEECKLNFSVFGRDKDKYSFIFLDCFTFENRDQLDKKLRCMQNEFGHICDHLNELLEDNKIVYKYIIAIKDFELSEIQERVIKENNFTVLTEIDVEYFENLHLNLEDAAYFQFCGKLFEGMTIPKINTKIPAIRGRMGGHWYYAFSIDPQILLRLSFVLHKTKAHEHAMPTYQRLVKRSRLVKIKDFLNKGGFFPNSIVLNLDEECVFEKQGFEDDYDTEIGYLNIPQKYRVAYIIDGQHRLMGYAGCTRGFQQIPVVAFEKLEKPTQVRLFMEMNENQKAVPKDLRNTLNKDLLSASTVLSERLHGLRLEIAYAFVDDENSPLKGHVGDGVDKGVFTLESLQLALSYCASLYFGTINKRNESLEVPGIFFRSNTDECFSQARDAMKKFLFNCLNALLEALKDAEALIDNEIKGKNVFIRNIAISGYLRFVADIVKYKEYTILQDIQEGDLVANPDKVFDIVRPYLQIVFDFMRVCESEEKERLRLRTGTAAPLQYQRTFQRELHFVCEDFNPSGLENWISKNSSEVVEEALDIIKQLKEVIKQEFKNRFSDKIGVLDWVEDSLPDGVNRSCYDRKIEFNKYATTEQNRDKSLWDFVQDEDYFMIACHPTNDPLIKEDFTFPGMKKSSAKNKRYDWMKKIIEIEKECKGNHSCEPKDLETLRELYDHFVGKDLIQEIEIEQ